jgi:methionine-gamma-lyase
MEGIRDMARCVLPPHDAFLIQRWLMTLQPRVKQVSENATKVAKLLPNHPEVERLYYPGNDVAQRQMGYFRSVLAFELHSGKKGCVNLLNRLRPLVLAVSLGGCESLIQYSVSS